MWQWYFAWALPVIVLFFQGVATVREYLDHLWAFKFDNLYRIVKIAPAQDHLQDRRDFQRRPQRENSSPCGSFFVIIPFRWFCRAGIESCAANLLYNDVLHTALGMISVGYTEREHRWRPQREGVSGKRVGLPISNRGAVLVTLCNRTREKIGGCRGWQLIERWPWTPRRKRIVFPPTGPYFWRISNVFSQVHQDQHIFISNSKNFPKSCIS